MLSKSSGATRIKITCLLYQLERPCNILLMHQVLIRSRRRSSWSLKQFKES